MNEKVANGLQQKFFFIEQSSDNTIWLKLTDGFTLYPLRPFSVDEDDRSISFNGVHAAIRAIQKYNFHHQTNYFIRTNIK